MASPVEFRDGLLILNCHLQPKARADEIVGLHGEALKIRITAPPVDGKANQHLIQFLAKLCQVRQQDVELLSGETSRTKRLAIQNVTRIPEILKIYLK